jgi:hypothetical protein
MTLSTSRYGREACETEKDHGTRRFLCKNIAVESLGIVGSHEDAGNANEYLIYRDIVLLLRALHDT